MGAHFGGIDRPQASIANHLVATLGGGRAQRAAIPHEGTRWSVRLGVIARRARADASSQFPPASLAGAGFTVVVRTLDRGHGRRRPPSSRDFVAGVAAPLRRRARKGRPIAPALRGRRTAHGPASTISARRPRRSRRQAPSSRVSRQQASPTAPRFVRRFVEQASASASGRRVQFATIPARARAPTSAEPASRVSALAAFRSTDVDEALGPHLEVARARRTSRRGLMSARMSSSAALASRRFRPRRGRRRRRSPRRSARSVRAGRAQALRGRTARRRARLERPARARQLRPDSASPARAHRRGGVCQANPPATPLPARRLPRRSRPTRAGRTRRPSRRLPPHRASLPE